MIVPRILIVDDEELIRSSLQEIIAAEGYDVFSSHSAEDAIKILRKNRIDIILLDMVLPGMGGLELLRLLKKEEFPCEVIIMTAYSTVESAVSAIKIGAYDYLIKPCNNDEIKLLIKRIVDSNSLKIENRVLREQLGKHYGLSNIISNNEKMKGVFDLVLIAASSNSTVLIIGETGTGKEMVAKALHNLSLRREKPLIKVDCASLPCEILESELFGHEKGAFTSAFNRREGRVELANDGTLFLDEISCLPLELQAKLLRMLQEKEFERLGSNKIIKVDIRIIAATNIDLEKLVEAGKFRMDLYYRLNVFTIHLPPLRERKDDTILLSNYFINLFNTSNNRKVKGITPEAMHILMNYNWPGNVRELKNCLESAVLLEKGEYITPASLPSMVKKKKEESLEDETCSINFKKKVMDYERKLILNALKSCGGRKKEAAKLLTLTPRLLSYYLKKYKPSG